MKSFILNPNPERLRVMKKIYIALAVAATALLVSCTREKSFDGMTPLNEGDIAFVIKNTETKSGVAAPTKATGVSLPVGTDDKGMGYFLEESVEELNPTPATKGAPAYTSNVGKIYSTMGVYATGTVNAEATFEVMDMYQHDKNDASLGDGWRYRHSYAGSAPWPDESTPVDFYFNIPASPTGVTEISRSGAEIGFKYASPATGEDQQDILFGKTSISKEDHDGYLPNGAPVTVYHALTGIRFRNGHVNDGETKTIITKVEFTNLKDNGSCVVNTSTGAVTWTGLGATLGSFYQEFENATYDKTLTDLTQNPDGTVGNANSDDDHKWNSDLNGTSWTAAASDHNLNDADGSLTFWLIPQTITEDATLKVTFRVKTADTPNGQEITHTISDFGAKLNGVQWKAGQLRTYTLEPKDIDVEIFDTMSGMKKSGLHVTNTGNVDEYVRMMIIGNWYGWLPSEDPATDEPTILVGYQHETGNEMVSAWYRENSTFSTGFDATFTGGKPSGTNKWIFGTGSYFYYPDAIGSGTTLDSATDALFQEYTLNPSWVPEIWIPVPEGGRRQAQGVHLIMECVIQAIGTKDSSGQPYADCWAAWSAATGETIAAKE